MKQSLEKLHRGIVVPEVQQDAADTLTESISEAWALLLKKTWWTGGVEPRDGPSCIRTHVCSLPHFQINNQACDMQGNITHNSFHLTDLKRQRSPSVSTSYNCSETIWTTAIICLQLQVTCRFCTETGHWWADSEHPLNFKMADHISESF